MFLRGNMKTCSFFGHRDTPKTDELKNKVREIVERLIVEEGVDTFLFGSRSNFDELCHIVVTELQKKYSHIRRVVYLCKHETACLVGAGMDLERQIKEITGRDVRVREFEEIKKSDRVNSAGRAAYVERNQEIINISNFCVFYYNLNHLSPKRKNSKEDIGERQLKSGTQLIFDYVHKRKKLGELKGFFNLMDK